MKLSIIIESVQDQTETLAKKYNTTSEKIIQTCRQINSKYWKWILSQWYQDRIILPEDNSRIQETLNNFRKAINRLQPNQKDINKYKSLTEIEQVVEPILGIQSSTKAHQNIENYPGVEIVQRRGPYITAKITSPTSLAKLGEGTKWCTRMSYPECQAQEYISEHEYIYTIFQNNRPVVQYTPNYEQVMDINNDPVQDPKLLSLIPPPPLDREKLSLIPHPVNISGVSEYVLYNYAANIIHGRWPEAEPIIMKDPESAYFYAKYVIKDRWPEAEPYIMQNPKWAHIYAKYHTYPEGSQNTLWKDILNTRRCY